MFFEKQERVIDFFFNHLVDRVVRKLIRVEGQASVGQTENDPMKIT
jgi:hypothetical protein